MAQSSGDLGNKRAPAHLFPRGREGPAEWRSLVVIMRTSARPRAGEGRPYANPNTPNSPTHYQPRGLAI